MEIEPEQCTAEISVDVPSSETYREWLHHWFDTSLMRLASDQVAAYERSAKPDDVRIDLLLSSVQLGGRAQNRQFSAKNLDWLCEGAIEGRTVACAVSLLDEQGFSTDSVLYASVTRSDFDKRYAEFGVAYPVADGGQDRLLDVLRQFAEVSNPLFGYAGRSNSVGGTEFEQAMGCTGLDECYPTARRYLRGYDWLTVMPDELIDRVGGLEALEAAGAFVEVARLGSGGAWLRATERFYDYDLDRAARVFLAVARALPPGTPRRQPQLGVQWIRTPVIYEDAADYGAA